MSINLDEFFRGEKTLSIAPEWVIQNSEWLGFSCPLDLYGITISGFRLQANSMLTQPDRHVILQMEHHPSSGKGGAFCRMEWRPMNGHNNKGLGPKEWRFLEIRGSHHHPFQLNWSKAEKLVRRGNLPIAVPLEPDPDNFRSFLSVVGREFNIKNIQRICEPPWQPMIL